MVLFEAQDRLGGQLALMARAGERQREVAGLLDWLVNEVALAGVDVRLSTPVDAGDVLAEVPDVVIVATGGSPEVSYLEAGADLVYTAWDVLGGLARPEGRVLVYDDHGAERGLAVVEFLVEKTELLGVSDIEVVTPDRHVGLDLATPLGPAYLRMLYEGGVTMTSDHRLVAVKLTDGGSLQTVMRNEYTRVEVNRMVDAVVVEHGVAPDAELYVALREASFNHGVVDLEALSAGRAQPAFTATDGGYLLYRVGDCVASRDVASALLDARRLLQHL